MSRSTPFVLAALRILVGLFFISSGLPKLLDPGSFVGGFSHWGLPEPALFVPTIGVLEVVGGGLLVLGVATRYVGTLLALDMLGAVLTAGRIDGGSHLILPPVLGFSVCSLSRAAAGRGNCPKWCGACCTSTNASLTSPYDSVWSVKTC